LKRETGQLFIYSRFAVVFTTAGTLLFEHAVED